MKTMMRCLVLTLALAVWGFAYKFIPVDLSRFKSSQYEIISIPYPHLLESYYYMKGIEEKYNKIRFVINTQYDKDKDLYVGFICPSDDAYLLEYKFKNQVILFKKGYLKDIDIDTKYAQYYNSYLKGTEDFCAEKFQERVKTKQTNEIDKEFLRQNQEEYKKNLIGDY